MYKNGGVVIRGRELFLGGRTRKRKAGGSERINQDFRLLGGRTRKRKAGGSERINQDFRLLGGRTRKRKAGGKAVFTYIRSM
jgi:hypothetical protein